MKRADADVRIDRRSKFGNPYRMEKDGGRYSRDGCVEAYKLWFAHRIRNDEIFRMAVEQLEGKRLGCWCAPERCHGEVILQYLAGELDVDALYQQEPDPIDQ